MKHENFVKCKLKVQNSLEVTDTKIDEVLTGGGMSEHKHGNA